MPTDSAYTSPPIADIELDALIIGGGIAGLWTLDTLTRANYRAMVVERTALGAGQSIWSQGIIHSGLKYTLSGSLHPAAKAIRDMPERWARSLAGQAGDDGPDLRGATVRSPHCWLWQTTSLSSRAGMIGARAGLRIAPVVVDPADRPEALRSCAGTVARLDEPVLDVGSVLGALAAAHAGRVVHSELDPAHMHPGSMGYAPTIRLTGAIVVRPRWVVIAAGNGAEAARAMFGLRTPKMQVRPLRMVMVRGDQPVLHGHCVDGAKTSATITSAFDAQGRTVWQVGGDIAERGSTMDPASLLAQARAELAVTLPSVDLSRCEWSTYDAPRAEGRTFAGGRPSTPTIVTEQRIITVWPTKLALAPVAADMVKKVIAVSKRSFGSEFPELPGAAAPPVPPIATPPWDNPDAVWMPTRALEPR